MLHLHFLSFLQACRKNSARKTTTISIYSRCYGPIFFPSLTLPLTNPGPASSQVVTTAHVKYGTQHRERNYTLWKVTAMWFTPSPSITLLGKYFSKNLFHLHPVCMYPSTAYSIDPIGINLTP